MEFLVKEGWEINPNERVVKSLTMMIDNNEGECCCYNKGLTKEDRMCPCKAYREEDLCCCKLYVKKK